MERSHERRAQSHLEDPLNELQKELIGLEELTTQKLSNALGLLTYFASKSVKLQSREVFKALTSLLENARHVDILGLTLLETIQRNRKCFYNKARDGCEFRFLVVDPSSPAISTAVGFWEGIEDRKQGIERTVRLLKPILNFENAKLRYMSLAPSVSLLIIDPEEPYGRVQVELYITELDSDSRPHFVLTKANEYWHKFFIDQFDRFWRSASETPRSKELIRRPDVIVDNDHKALMRMVAKHFNLDELKTLCVHLEVQYEDIPGETITAKARELAAFMEREGRIDDLKLAILNDRSHLIRYFKPIYG